MAGISRWQKTVRRAKADEVLCGIARHIQWHNLTYRAPDRAAHMAFEDRTTELGLYVPKGYLPFVLDACLPPLPATN